PAAPAIVGGKAHNLARLASTGVEVPPWFAITVAAFHDIALTGASVPDGEQAESWRANLVELPLPGSFRSGLREFLHLSGLPDKRPAVRASAVGEDGAGASCAGQFDSVRGVRVEAVDAAIARVWASAAGDRAVGYGGRITAMAVIVQEMIDAE